MHFYNPRYLFCFVFLIRYTRRSKYFQFFRKNKYRRYIFVCAFLFVAFFFFMLVLEKLGSEVPIVDDPLLNPNIRVNDANSWLNFISVAVGVFLRIQSFR